MKNTFARLAIASSALFAASSANAADVASYSAPAYSGVIEMFGGYSMLKGDNPEYGDDRKNNPIMGGFSAVNLPLSGGMSVQLDLSGNALFPAGGEGEAENDFTNSSLHPTVHVSGRNDGMLFGGFGGVGRVNFHNTDSSTYVFGGAELQAYLGATTLYLQGGYLDSMQAEEADDDTLNDAYFVRGVARFYVSETSRMSTQVAYASGETDTDADFEEASALAWGARFDQQLPDSPASVFLGYTGAHYKGGASYCDASWYDHRVMVGVTFAFGGDTIMANDRQGVALDTPDFGNWVGAGEMNQAMPEEDDCGVL